MNNNSDFLSAIKTQDCKILIDSPMSAQTTFRVGGNARAIAFPRSADELKDLVQIAKRYNEKIIITGNGSNILVKDSGIDGLVIKTTAMSGNINVSGNTVHCPAGVQLSKLCIAAYENSLTGLEFAYGIPGTVGGAVFMNAGAYGGEIKDVIVSAEHLSPDGKIESLTSDMLGLSYRSSFYSKNTEYIITAAEFNLKKGDKAEIKAKMDELMAKRKAKQPLEYPSAGSTFKRPEGYFAGALIENAGLKGFSVGGAKVSEKHAGFVINTGCATAQDILDLIDHVKKTVKETSGVTLEPEIKIIP